jgi:hypothetical protein
VGAGRPLLRAADSTVRVVQGLVRLVGGGRGVTSAVVIDTLVFDKVVLRGPGYNPVTDLSLVPEVYPQLSHERHNGRGQERKRL